MIPRYLSAIWAATATAMGNHLWQSTACLAIAGLLTLILRNNHARTRYGIWLAASIKFLIPFSLLIAMGSHLARPRVLPTTQTGFFMTMEEVSQPFTQASSGFQTLEKGRRPAQDAGLRYRLIQMLPAILVATWFCGFVVVVFVWYVRRRRISAALREAVTLQEGREVEALRRAERLGGLQKPIELLVSPTSLEPGIFGIAQPVLVWPKGLSERVDDAQLEGILAHEVWHVRRRDNLAAAIHMVVEALFWFHPLVWWLASRLVDERERACDEEVLAMGSERRVYAESVLKTCEFCVESPLVCVAGVAGADLKKRIVRIMTQSLANNLSLTKRLVLYAAGVGVIAVPLLAGAMAGPQLPAHAGRIRLSARGGFLTWARSGANGDADPSLEFQTVSIKPSNPNTTNRGLQGRGHRYTVHNATLAAVLETAYDVQLRQIVGGPDWLDIGKFDITGIQNALAEPTDDQWDSMLRNMVADRFKLSFHVETRNLPVYLLSLGDNGPSLPKSGSGGVLHPFQLRPVPGGVMLYVLNGTVRDFINLLQRTALDRPMLDRTDLPDQYNILLTWAPDKSQFTGSFRVAWSASENPPPDLATAMQQQLGLKLEPSEAPVDVLVIDHVEKPLME